MARLRKVTVYVLDLNDPVSDKDLTYHLTDCDYYIAKVGKIEHAEIGPWHDDHESNKRGADYEKYFREEKYGEIRK